MKTVIIILVLLLASPCWGQSYFGWSGDDGDAWEGIGDLSAGGVYQAGQTTNVDTLEFKIFVTIQTHLMKACIYLDSDSSLLGTTSEVTITPTYDDWQKFGFATPVAVTSGTNYILVLKSDDGEPAGGSEDVRSGTDAGGELWNGGYVGVYYTEQDPYVWSTFTADKNLLARAYYEDLGGGNFLDQNRTWEHTTSALNGAYLNVSYIDKDDPDSSFDHSTAAAWVNARGDSASGWNEVIMIDMVWDSIFGSETNKIADPSTVDSVIIDSAKLWVAINSWDKANVCTVTAYRLHTDINYDGSGLFPCWDNPASGQGWDGATFAFSDLVSADSTLTAIDVISQIGLPVGNIFQRFADSTGRRTGIAITIVRGQADSMASFLSEAYLSGGVTRMSLEVWWNEYGLNTESDSQKVGVADNFLYTPDRYSLGDPTGEKYNYGGAESLKVLQYDIGLFTDVREARPVLMPENLGDSLAYTDTVYIDSVKLWFNVTTKLGSSDITIDCHELIVGWNEGTLDGTEDTLTSSWIYTGKVDTEAEPDWAIEWDTEGAAGTAISSLFDNAVVDGTGWFSVVIPHLYSQGMFEQGNSPSTYSGMRMSKTSKNRSTEDSLFIASMEYSVNTALRPYFMFYYSWEVAAEVAATAPRRRRMLLGGQ